jgi:hypothetical protein
VKCCDPTGKRQLALAHLGRAHRSGALGELAAASLGDLTAGAWFPDRSEIDAETEAFDGRLNAWMVDYQSGFEKIPASVAQQVDDFISRWRDLRSTYYFLGKVRADAVLAMESEWNRLKDQVAGYGATSSVAAATVLVDGKAVRADQIPPGSSTLDRVETIVKWGAVLVGGVAAWKVASDLGLVAKVSRLFSGGGGRGGGPARRFGSAKLGG